MKSHKISKIVKETVNIVREAVSLRISNAMFQGIERMELVNVEISLSELDEIAWRSTEFHYTELVVQVDIALFTRVSNVDVLRSDQRFPFWVTLIDGQKGLVAVAINENGWESAWQNGLELTKAAALEAMNEEVHKISVAVEGTHSFEVALILIASRTLGPYPDRIATFLGYPVDMVQIVGFRLHEAGLWTDDEVRCEGWSEPLKRNLMLTLDVMVGQGCLRRTWSEEDQRFKYHGTDVAELVMAIS